MPGVRMLRGHVQRYLNHRSSMGYRYGGGELSVPCPTGCSGAPVYRDGYTERGLTGIVTENIQVSLDVSRSEEIEKTHERTTTHVYREVTRYGICLVLKDMVSWLDEVAPP
jgi:hypothetical protein